MLDGVSCIEVRNFVCDDARCSISIAVPISDRLVSSQANHKLLQRPHSGSRVDSPTTYGSYTRCRD